MVHRAWLDDPMLTEFDFGNSQMPPPHQEERIDWTGLLGVRDVYAANGARSGAATWVAVTRAEGEAWDTLAPRVQALLDAMPEHGEEEQEGRRAAEDAAGAARTEGAAEEEEPPSDDAGAGVAAEIEEVLEHRVRPTVQADGGDVELVRWVASSGEVVLRLRGACRGCPQSAVTLRETILGALRFFVPEVRLVTAEEEPFDAEAAAADPTADLPWDHCGEPAAGRVEELAAAGTPFFSTFAGDKVLGRRLQRVRFLSHIELAGRRPEHILVNCVDCRARRTIEDPQDLLRADKGNSTGNT